MIYLRTWRPVFGHWPPPKTLNRQKFFGSFFQKRTFFLWRYVCAALGKNATLPNSAIAFGAPCTPDDVTFQGFAKQRVRRYEVAVAGTLAQPEAARVSMMPRTQGEWQIILLTLKVAALAVIIAFPPAWFAGRLLAARTRARVAIAAAVNLPLVLPPVVTGWLLLTLLGAQGPVGAWLQTRLGIGFAFTTTGAALACAVMAFPLMARAIRLGLEAADRDVLAMAESLGAGPMDRLFAVALPLAAPGLLLALVTGFTASVGQFGAVIIFAGSMPGETQTLPLALYAALQTPDAAATAARLALASIALALLGALTAEALTRRLRR